MFCGVVDELGIYVIILEVGNFNIFQKGYICFGFIGIYNVLVYLGMIGDMVEELEEFVILCKDFSWLYMDMGGDFYGVVGLDGVC